VEGDVVIEQRVEPLMAAQSANAADAPWWSSKTVQCSGIPVTSSQLSGWSDHLQLHEACLQAGALDGVVAVQRVDQ
jgi:hypothetical protein